MCEIPGAAGTNAHVPCLGLNQLIFTQSGGGGAVVEGGEGGGLESKRSPGALLLGAQTESPSQASLPASGDFQQPVGFLGLWLHHPDLCLHLHMGFVSLCLLCLL